jgi:hypothetical protein
MHDSGWVNWKAACGPPFKISKFFIVNSQNAGSRSRGCVHYAAFLTTAQASYRDFHILPSSLSYSTPFYQPDDSEANATLFLLPRSGELPPVWQFLQEYMMGWARTGRVRCPTRIFVSFQSSARFKLGLLRTKNSSCSFLKRGGIRLKGLETATPSRASEDLSPRRRPLKVKKCSVCLCSQLLAHVRHLQGDWFLAHAVESHHI